MNPSNNNAGMELPPPSEQPSTIPEQSPAENLPMQSPEAMPTVQESSPASIQSVPMPVPTTVPLPQPPASTSVQDDSATQDDQKAAANKLLKDKDLIEKEWVNKAKAIVEQTRDYPFKQSEDLTNLKADYMKREFNKTIKLNN
jgi:hypothetical protein